jgi:RNA polymerase sigma factor (sigma-70 family)
MENQTNFYRSRWAQACEENNQRLISYARRLANGNVADADDLVQETIFRVLVHGCNPSRIENLIGYLFRVMQNAWTSKRMKERRESMDSLDDLLIRSALKNQPAIDPDVLQILENQEFQKDFKVRKGPLNAREMQILELYLAGYKCQEIAAELNEDKRVIGVELNAVRNKVRYRLKRKSRTGAIDQLPRTQALEAKG